MPKRQHYNENEEDDVPSRASSKRARTDGSSDEEDEAPATRRTRGARTNGRSDNRRAGDEQSEGEEDEAEVEEDEANENDEPEIDDEEFERIHGEKLRARLQSRRKVQGGVAEHGIIEYIEMHQFMCHKFLKFTFGPQINFIIGHNGSGKSAVLSAITVALGGKAASTGRGNGLKSFIREGQSWSEVTIHIKNQGDEAYKPKEYGKTIVITRKFGKDGQSSWKIQSKNLKTISTKKDELAAICDHMNIQVDNPMNVLTQDAARQFLSASAPADKYKFFLRGTQLSQLSEEYEICLENISQTAKLLAVKKEALPDLLAKLNEVHGRFEEAKKAREQKRRVDDLKKELAWSHVASKRAEMETAIEDAAKLARRLPKITESLEKAKADVEAATAETRELEAQLGELEDIKHLDKRRTSLQDKIRENKNIIKGYNSELREMDTSMNTLVGQMAAFDQQIAEETRRMAANTQGKHEETQRKLEAAKQIVSDHEHEIRELSLRRKEISVEADRLYEEGDSLIKGEKTRLQAEIAQCDNDINAAKKSENDALIPYGNNMKTLLQKIQSSRWTGDPPLGPLGQFVKSRDPKTWGNLLRSQLAPLLCAFAITDARDRPLLKKLLMESNNAHTSIVVYEKDLFDFRHGEPPEGLHTVLRELEISDPYALRILINQAHIENQILCHRRDEAESVLKGLRASGRGGGSAWSLNGFNVRVFPDGGGQSSPLNMRSLNGSANLLLTGRDSAAEIKHTSERKAELEIQYRALCQNIAAKQSRWNKLKTDIDKDNTSERQLQSQLRTAKANLSNIQNEANEDLPLGVQGFEDAKQACETEKLLLKEQFKHVTETKINVSEAQTKLLTELNEVKALLDDYAEKRNEITVQVEGAIGRRMNAQNAQTHFEGKLKQDQKKVDDADEIARVVELEFNNWTAKALEYCAEVPNPRKTADVQRNLDSVQKALQEREKQHGKSVEEMSLELNRAQEAYSKARHEHHQMSILNKALNQSLIVRLARWQEFRRHIALRCKQVFQFHLSQRGYYGKILFDHGECTLQLKVQTDDQIQTQGSAEKDPRSLSGGEKSFSTICLLLSLWECIGCPLRCLDEFDVFMDAVNRRISMKMMIDTANTSDRKQYVLITPQDMSNVSMGPTVKVHRMTDPERGNGTLQFGSAA